MRSPHTFDPKWKVKRAFASKFWLKVCIFTPRSSLIHLQIESERLHSTTALSYIRACSIIEHVRRRGKSVLLPTPTAWLDLRHMYERASYHCILYILFFAKCVWLVKETYWLLCLCGKSCGDKVGFGTLEQSLPHCLLESMGQELIFRLLHLYPDSRLSRNLKNIQNLHRVLCDNSLPVAVTWLLCAAYARK